MDSVWVTNGEKIFVTTNKGMNWETMDIKIEEFSFISNNRAYGLSENRILYTENGWESYSIIDSVLVGLELNEEIKYTYKLYQNYPNPFNPSTTISYSIPHRSFVQLKVYDILGKEVAQLVNEEKQIGNYEVEFDASYLSSGVYIYQLQSGGFISSKTMLLLK